MIYLSYVSKRAKRNKNGIALGGEGRDKNARRDGCRTQMKNEWRKTGEFYDDFYRYKSFDITGRSSNRKFARRECTNYEISPFILYFEFLELLLHANVYYYTFTYLPT